MEPYEIGSLIISAVGTIATFSAVVVALWQTKYANQKRLKCCFTENNTLCSSNMSQHKSYVGMDITNIGNKKVIVKSWGIKTPNQFLLIITYIANLPNADIFDKMISVKTPYDLEAERNITLFYAKDLFHKQIKNLIDSGEMKESILFIVKDSTGKEYKVKSKKPANYYLPKEWL